MESPFLGDRQCEEWRESVPLSELTQRLQGAETPFLLESGGGPMSQWHLLGAYPVGEIRVWGARWEARLGTRNWSGDEDPWRGLEDWWQAWAVGPDATGKLPELPAGLPFGGGAVGYLGYELGEHLEDIAPPHAESKQWPDAHLYLYDEVVAIERDTGRVFFVHYGREGQQGRRWWDQPCASPESSGSPVADERVSLPDARYLEAVDEIRELIRQGEVYEVNLCRRHSFRGGPDVWQIHEQLRRRQPVPYAAVLPWSPLAVVSASPERFLRRWGNQVETRPIKGTAPRGQSDAEDERAARELLANEKERAELAMIIDLERNDLGRVCVPGSVRVLEEAAIEKYSTVIHSVATVRGELREGASPWPLLRATFPGGSITGAPKIASMKVIRNFEPAPRSVYTGAIGWLGANGDLDLNIAIRTILRTQEQLYYSVGGAITWGSEPERELRELGAKGAAIRATILGSSAGEDS